jgi:hypothetical protein
MSEPFPDAVQFGPHTAFVVQLLEGAPVSSASVVGRIEHVASGRAARFASAAQLVDFMAAALRSPEEEGTGDA